MDVYKVVLLKKERMWSCRSHIRGNLDLAIEKSEAPEEKILEYKLGEVTVPKFGAIFAFGSPEAAIGFACLYCYEQDMGILAGKGIIYRRKGYAFLPCYYSSDTLIESWNTAIRKKRVVNSKSAFCSTSHLPPGTVLLKSFKPLKLVQTLPNLLPNRRTLSTYLGVD